MRALADDDMADRLRDLGRCFPRLAIHIKTDWTAVLIESVGQGLLDVAVCVTCFQVLIACSIRHAVEQVR